MRKQGNKVVAEMDANGNWIQTLNEGVPASVHCAWTSLNDEVRSGCRRRQAAHTASRHGGGLETYAEVEKMDVSASPTHE